MEECRRELLMKLFPKVLHIEDGGRQSVRGHRQHCERAKCWQCRRERFRFYLSIVMIPALCAVAVGIILLSPSVVVQAGAAVALWATLRSITKSIMS